ncbi:DUF2628 domain-containing protein [Burkholderia ubonensis]|uniref:DUF2628 domain-containing protein n=1 Tax=Burkholderia ubonensis TaxID=101571 RepID=UPI0009B34F57|nr:DUF2628 domain-containing protein [Burkholderia ubonensis]
MQVQNDIAVASFVGKKVNYYQKKWAVGTRRRGGMSWNWAAFLFSGLWLAYRRMYWQALLTVFAWSVAFFLSITFFPPPLGSKVINVLNIGMAVTLGWRGNDWYKAHVEAVIERLRAKGSCQEQFEVAVRRRGGTSWLAVIGVFLCLLALIYPLIVLRNIVIWAGW